MRAALILTGGDVNGAVADNVIVIDPDDGSDLNFKVLRLYGASAVVVPLADNEPCAPGWVRSGSGWVDPSETPEKVRAKAILDANTDAADQISAGFLFKGKRLSLSIAAQVRILGIMVDLPGNTFPIVWNTIDDSDTVSVDSSNEMRSLYRAACDAVRAAVDAATTKKSAARSKP